MTELSRNRDLAAAIIAAAKLRVAEKFPIGRLIDNTLASYEKALSG
jgi:hypothetical protein